MKRMLGLLAISFALLAVWAPRVSAQDTDTYIISTYRVAPGQHIAFLEWMANQEAASRDAAAAPDQDAMRPVGRPAAARAGWSVRSAGISSMKRERTPNELAPKASENPQPPDA